MRDTRKLETIVRTFFGFYFNSLLFFILTETVERVLKHDVIKASLPNVYLKKSVS